MMKKYGPELKDKVDGRCTNGGRKVSDDAMEREMKKDFDKIARSERERYVRDDACEKQYIVLIAR
jgi:hypothetical protein